ncbi:hypothetical protein BS78_K155000 [Paspalum vaginatum]|uniref:Uncharacterized protein n=1 Tax=Paspalum vaginatum TaxID=158149 RepID=A0A9W7XF98_9POAL|nr:hypothetical protein BS78_K155000 [Paspalum vaginatum]KAJ1257234.1 hypothetical protein BS78_K155000 [Paspalum vaginatum]
MASCASAEAAFLPLRLVSVALRPVFSRSSFAALLAVAALLTAICALPDAGADTDALLSEIEALRLKVARLESLLEENANTLNSKASILEEDNKLIEAMERGIQLLVNEPASAKKSQRKSYSAGDIKSMEDEVQLLHQEISKINSNSYTIESLAHNTQKRVEALSLEVQKIEDINTEQWIQIRQLEQAFVLTKMMTSKVHKRSRLSDTAYKWPGKETIVKASRFCKTIHHQYIPDIDKPDVFFLGGSVSRSSISLPYNQFKIFISSTQKFHHEVQVFIHNVMESNKYSKGLANEPVTFILAYLLVVSPMWIAWFLYSTWMGSRK